MTNHLRTYGCPPYSVAVIHGGPGAAGDMAPVANELSSLCGILEPLQTADTLEGQVQELQRTLQENAAPPVALIGHSWGAWLSYIVTARNPKLVRKLLLVGSGPFEEKYASAVEAVRLKRLDEREQSRYHQIMRSLDDSHKGENISLSQLGDLVSRIDQFDPEPPDSNALELNLYIYRSVWAEAKELRRSGELLRIGRMIRCPVIAFHGDYDPHPFEGVEEPLARTLTDFRFVLLERCGHKPWIERQARDRFFELVKREL